MSDVYCVCCRDSPTLPSYQHAKLSASHHTLLAVQTTPRGQTPLIHVVHSQRTIIQPCAARLNALALSSLGRLHCPSPHSLATAYGVATALNGKTSTDICFTSRPVLNLQPAFQVNPAISDPLQFPCTTLSAPQPHLYVCGSPTPPPLSNLPCRRARECSATGRPSTPESHAAQSNSLRCETVRPARSPAIARPAPSADQLPQTQGRCPRADARRRARERAPAASPRKPREADES